MTESINCNSNNSLETFLPKLIWLGAFTSFAIYIFVAFSAINDAEHKRTHQDITIISSVLTIFSAILFGLVLHVRNRVNSPAFRLALVNGEKLPFLLNLFLSQANSFDKNKTPQGKLFLAYMLMWGLENSIAIFGLVLSTTSTDITYAITFGTVAVVLHCFTFPNTELPHEL